MGILIMAYNPQTKLGSISSPIQPNQPEWTDHCSTVYPDSEESIIIRKAGRHQVMLDQSPKAQGDHIETAMNVRTMWARTPTNPLEMINFDCKLLEFSWIKLLEFSWIKLLELSWILEPNDNVCLHHEKWNPSVLVKEDSKEARNPLTLSLNMGS